MSTATYATTANPTLQRHHWQGLACLINSVRPGWEVSEIIEELWASRNLQNFPELARIALAVAMEQRFNRPGSIHLAAMGVIRL